MAGSCSCAPKWARELTMWRLPLSGERTAAQLPSSKSSEFLSEFSPDGRWVAYTSDASGREQVYVRAVAGNTTQVRSVTFKCRRIECGSTDVRRYGGCDLKQRLWLAGDPMDPEREIPTQTKWEREDW